MAEGQLATLLLLLLFTSRRAFVYVPPVDYLYGILIKMYALIHMSRILADTCDGVPKLAVATFATMAGL
tara:strand:- start:5860 stop:6066 length:207 start_codon:yes stop_codon:yes gene_type:complete